MVRTTQVPRESDGQSSSGSRKRFWTWMGETRRVTNGQVLIGTIVLLTVLGLLFGAIQTGANQRVDDVRITGVRSKYLSDVTNYTQAVTQRDACITTTKGSLANRSQWQVAVDQLLAANLTDAAAALQAGPLLTGPPREYSTCGAQPSPPPVPPELVGEFSPITVPATTLPG